MAASDLVCEIVLLTIVTAIDTILIAVGSDHAGIVDAPGLVQASTEVTVDVVVCTAIIIEGVSGGFTVNERPVLADEFTVVIDPLDQGKGRARVKDGRDRLQETSKYSVC